MHQATSFQVLRLSMILVFGILACATTSGGHKTVAEGPAGEAELAQRYLADPNTPAAFKEGIRSGVVVAGMCPLQAFAAAGLPGPYMVRRDKSRWAGDIPPPDIIDAQCAAPDESVIELMFRNRTQFATAEPAVFRVRFVKGKVVLIDQKGFKE